MFLKNYTSAVPVSQTIARIEAVLLRCGVNGITKEYGPPPAPGQGGKIIAIKFHLRLLDRDLTVRLPADEQKAWDALWEDYKFDHPTGAKRGVKTRDDFRAQAERTAWKLMQDWVEVQLSMIQLKQAEFVQVFLPYIYEGGQTFYERLQTSNYQGLLPEKTS